MLTEEQLAERDEYRDAVDRIAARHPDVVDASTIVALIRDGIEHELRLLVPVEMHHCCDRPVERQAVR